MSNIITTAAQARTFGVSDAVEYQFNSIMDLIECTIKCSPDATELRISDTEMTIALAVRAQLIDVGFIITDYDIQTGIEW